MASLKAEVSNPELGASSNQYHVLDQYTLKACVAKELNDLSPKIIVLTYSCWYYFLLQRHILLDSKVASLSLLSLQLLATFLISYSCSTISCLDLTFFLV